MFFNWPESFAASRRGRTYAILIRIAFASGGVGLEGAPSALPMRASLACWSASSGAHLLSITLLLAAHEVRLCGFSGGTPGF
jgi:hypothetical protein